MLKVIELAIQNMRVPSPVDGQGIQRALSLAMWRLLLAHPDQRKGVLKEIKDLLESEGVSES